MDLLAQYIRPSRLKIVQKSADQVLLDKFKVGDLILSPENVLVAGLEPKDSKSGQRFHFVPLFFFPEWCTLNPFKLRGQVDMIRERTFDGTSPLAIKAKNKATRIEPYPEDPDPKKGLQIRHVEFLNYIVVLMGEGDACGIPILVSFSRGDIKSGGILANLITMRKLRAIYGNVFQGRTKFRPNNQGDYYGIDISNPDADTGVSMWVSKPQFERLAVEHAKYQEKFDRQLIVADYGDPDEIDASAERSF
jgi:hypothetical protein